MAHKTFDLLSRHGGAKALMSGATQIRVGVIRPEIIISLQPATDPSSAVEKISTSRRGIAIGEPGRVIREPYFGQIGRGAALATDLQAIPTGSRVREVELPNAERMIVPRTNVEILEG